MIPISLSTTPQFYGHIIWEEISKMWIVNVPTSIFFRATWSNKWRFVSLRHHQPLNKPHTDQKTMKNIYRSSSYSFRSNYSFLNLEILRSQYIGPKVIVHKCAENIQGRKLFKGGNYMMKYGIPYTACTVNDVLGL